MHTFLDAKTMAKTLRAALAERSIDISHSDSLELVARQFGLDDWNTLAARIQQSLPLALPPGWYAHHSAPYPLHQVGRDATEKGAVTILGTASADVIGGNFATLMQSIVADEYRSQTIRLTGRLRGEGADKGVLWMRIDQSGAVGKSLRFDNMMTRTIDGPLSGRFGWTERSIVLDVPVEAGTIHFGPMLKGAGQLWARDIKLEIVDGDTPRTGHPRRPLGFGEGSVA